MKQELILVGAGGHCVSVIDAIEGQDKYIIKGILDNEKEIGSKILDYPIIGNDDDIANYKNTGLNFLITVGQIKSPAIRISIASLLDGASLATIISPSAYVSKHARVNAGSVILHGATVNAGASIGRHCIINTQANIEHGVLIEDYCHISTGVMINGDCIIGEGSFIGSNSTLIQGKKIEKNTVVSAGLFLK
jgi:sugar O-acyltransferase (sialic acid O-acetyltransferase NeuD family)